MGFTSIFHPKTLVQFKSRLKHSFCEVQQIQTCIRVMKLTNNPKHNWMTDNKCILHCFRRL